MLVLFCVSGWSRLFLRDVELVSAYIFSPWELLRSLGSLIYLMSEATFIFCNLLNWRVLSSGILTVVGVILNLISDLDTSLTCTCVL